MKAILEATMMAVFVLVALCAGWGIASEQETGARPGQYAPPPPPDEGIHLLVKYEMDNMTAQLIAELTGKSVETILAGLGESDIHAFLQKNEVDETFFKAGMKENMTALVNDALVNGRITQAQADEIIRKINTRLETPDMGRP